MYTIVKAKNILVPSEQFSPWYPTTHWKQVPFLWLHKLFRQLLHWLVQSWPYVPFSHAEKWSTVILLIYIWTCNNDTRTISKYNANNYESESISYDYWPEFKGKKHFNQWQLFTQLSDNLSLFIVLLTTYRG